MSANNRSRRHQFAEVPAMDEPAELPTNPQPEITDPLRARAPDSPFVLVPIGAVDVPTVELLVPILESAFQRKIKMHVPLPVPKYAFNPTRNQYHSAAIMKRVETLLETSPEYGAAVGFVDVDLFVPEVPYIFGEADRSTRSAVVSLTRLRPESGTADYKRDNLMRRLTIETIHQVGLIRGLAQCPNNRCVMFYSATIQETDKKGSTFCANCRKRLAAEA